MFNLTSFFKSSLYLQKDVSSVEYDTTKGEMVKPEHQLSPNLTEEIEMLKKKYDFYIITIK